MKIKVVITLSLISLIIALNHSVLSQVSTISDDSKLKRFEIGGQFTFLRRSDPDITDVFLRNNGFLPGVEPLNESDYGFGLRFTYNFTRNVAVEAESNYFPQNKIAVIPNVPARFIDEYGGRKLQTVFGLKTGLRKKRIGVFGKIRPGLIRLERFEYISEQSPLTVCFPLGCLPSYTISRTKSTNFFDLDVGGVFEYYLTRRTALRFDIGDTIIRYSKQEPRDLNPGFTRHNLQISAGFGFRF